MSSLIASVVFLVASNVAAQSRQLVAGRAAFERASFDAATEWFEHALEDPAATRDDLAEAHRYLAALRAAMDHATARATLEVTLAPRAGAVIERASGQQVITAPILNPRGVLTNTNTTSESARLQRTPWMFSIGVGAGVVTTIVLATFAQGCAQLGPPHIEP